MAILFEHLFREFILERGYDYFLQGSISRLKRENNEIWATVQGSEDYSVYIELNDDGIAELDCTCPYFQGGHNCKHLAAVLYALDEQEPGTGEVQVRSDLSQAIEILEALPKDDVIDFFGRELERNESLRTRFLSTYQGRGTLSESLYHRQIDSTFEYYLGRSGFIDYDQRDAFYADVRDLISSIRDLVEDERYQAASVLIQHLVLRLVELEMDDSRGRISWFIDDLIEILQRILDEGPNSLHANTFAWLYDAVQEGTPFDPSDAFLDVFMTYFQEETQLRKKLTLIDEKLQPYSSERSRFGEPRRAYWLGHKIKALWTLNEHEQARELCSNHLDIPAIRSLVVEHHLAHGEYDKAVALLNEGKKRMKNRWGITDQYSRRLMDIYRKLDDHRALRAEGLLRVLEYARGNLDAYLEYKTMFPAQEWPAEMDRILSELKKQRVDLTSIYAAEELWNDLLAALREDPNNWYLDECEKLLKDQFPEEVRNILVRRVIQLAEHAGGRKHYRRIRYELQRIAGYPGGARLVNDLKVRWATEYKRRRAMMDELDLT